MSAMHITKDNFEQEVVRSDKPVLLDFWAPWCAPCRMVVPVVEEIALERSDIKVGKINIDEEPDLAQQFRIMSIPTLMVVENGEILHRVVGALSKEQILDMLP
ncbi:MAG: thioredoxin [Clostridiales bacterium]|nr:thioredoxin [Clostridiales bacterium]